MIITAMLMFWVRLPAFSWRQMYGNPRCVLVRLDPLCKEFGCPRVYLLICICPMVTLSACVPIACYRPTILLATSFPKRREVRGEHKRPFSTRLRSSTGTRADLYVCSTFARCSRSRAHPHASSFVA